jgi:uncharacterized coiled-coil DUF342 family protein
MFTIEEIQKRRAELQTELDKYNALINETATKAHRVAGGINELDKLLVETPSTMKAS